MLIVEELKNNLKFSNPYTLSYQSRVGPEEWLKPYTEDVLEELGKSSVEELVVVPISFVGGNILKLCKK